MILVQRHGGMKRHHWRTVYMGVDTAKAEQRYAKELLNVKQGSVRIMVDGKVTKLQSAAPKSVDGNP
jgi:hypothetical protein